MINWRKNVVLEQAKAEIEQRPRKRRAIIPALFATASATALLVSINACSSDGGERASQTNEAVVSDGDGGYLCTSTWEAGTYNYVTNHCWNAANDGIEAGNAGSITCSTYMGGPGGHAINYDFPDDMTTCLQEPQRPGSAACCWPAAPLASGQPDLSSMQAQACLAQLCGTDAAMPVVLDAGQLLPVAPDCQTTTTTSSACNACCTSNANMVPDSWGDAAISQRQMYLTSCQAACATKPAGCEGETTNASCTQCCLNLYPANSPGWQQCVTAAGCASKP